jgi:type I restriction enzyme S subunit
VTDHLAWTQQLPTGWAVKPLRAVSNYVVSNVDKIPVDGELPVRLCNYSDVYNNEFIFQRIDFMACTATKDEITKFGLLVDDVIITKDSESWDDIGIPALVVETAEDLVCGYHLALLRPHETVLSGRFLLRCLQAKVLRIQLELAANGVTRFGLPKSDIGAMRLPVPPLERQLAIADFLDRETARLDALVAAKQRLLELLAEKRKAIIATTITRGLDTKVKLRDSGVPWLGEIPAHWEIRRVRTISQFITSGPRGWSERVGDEGSLFIQSGDLNDSLQVAFETAKRVSVTDDAEAARTKLQDGDIVVCITGAKTGNVAVCAYVPEPAYVNQHLCLVRPTADVLPVFLGSALKSSVGQRQFTIFQYGLKQSLNLEDVREVVVALPPLAEQHAIVEHIAREATKLDTVRAATERTIALLKERRSALIASAVTGQLETGTAA